MGSAPFGGRVTLPDHGRLGRRDPKGAAHDVDAAGMLHEHEPVRSDDDAEEQVPNVRMAARSNNPRRHAPRRLARPTIQI